MGGKEWCDGGGGWLASCWCESTEGCTQGSASAEMPRLSTVTVAVVVVGTKAGALTDAVKVLIGARVGILATGVCR